MSPHEAAIADYGFNQRLQAADADLGASLGEKQLTSPSTWAYLVPKRITDVDEAAARLDSLLKELGANERQPAGLARQSGAAARECAADAAIRVGFLTGSQLSEDAADRQLWAKQRRAPR